MSAGLRERLLAKADSLDGAWRTETQLLLREAAAALDGHGDAAQRVAPSKWQPIETAPRGTGTDLLFWVVAKTAEEAFVDTSGNPIFSGGKPRIHRGSYGSWSSLSKATHWMPLPEPPAPSGNPECSGCGGPHPFDTSVPSVVWNAVIRDGGLPDYLCLTCVVKAFAAAERSFTAELYGSGFRGLPIEVQVRSQPALDARAVCEENNRLRSAWFTRAEKLNNLAKHLGEAGDKSKDGEGGLDAWAFIANDAAKKIRALAEPMVPSPPATSGSGDEARSE